MNRVSSGGKGLGMILAALGLSKPLDTEKQREVVIRTAPKMANVDGNDSAMPLSYRFDNQIPMQNSFAGTAVDEMSMKYLLSMPNYIYTGNYTTSSLGKVIFSTQLTPTWLSKDFYLPASPTDVKVRQPTLLSYIAKPFRYWRGGFVFTIRFIKCDYVSGRLAVVYSPFALPVGNEAFNRSEYAYKLIIDLRENTEFTFTVPYMRDTDFMNVVPGSDPLTDAYDSDTNSGYLGIIPLTNLQVSSALLPNNIDFVVEVRAASDFEFVAPINGVPSPVLQNSAPPKYKVQSGEPIQAPGIRDTRMESLESTQDPPSIIGKPLQALRKSLVCCGEEIISIRDFIKRFDWAGIADNSHNPFSLLTVPVLFSSGATDNLGLKYDKLKGIDGRGTQHVMYWAALYGFFTGGLNLKYFGNNLNSYTMFKIPGGGLPTAIEFSSLKPINEISVPYYSRVQYNPLNVDFPLFPDPNIGILSDGKPAVAAIGLSAKDDLRFGYLLGPPIVVDAIYTRHV